MFRFTIRDVLWLMVVVAVAAGWWNDRRTIQERTLQDVGRLWEEHVTTEHSSNPNDFKRLLRRDHLLNLIRN